MWWRAAVMLYGYERGYSMLLFMVVVTNLYVGIICGCSVGVICGSEGLFYYFIS
jgi:hypothetical protein